MLVVATPAHAEAMALLHSRAFAGGEHWSSDAIGLQLGLPGVFGWIALSGGMILARTIADEAEVLTLAVQPAAQRAGIGRALLSRALATARLHGAVAMFLEVSSTNAAARGLYTGAGFVQVGSRLGYYPEGGDALVLRRLL